MEDGVDFREGDFGIHPIDGAGGGEGAFLDAVGAGGFEDIDCAFDVGALVEGGLFEAGADAGAGCEVDDLVEAFGGEHFIDDMGFRDIADDDGEGFSEGLEVEEVGLFDLGVVEVVEVIEGMD